MSPLPENPTFPALYRQHVYFLSSIDARIQFMSNPLAYLCQRSPKPVVPIRVAIVGPPKSGKTTRTINYDYFIVFCIVYVDFLLPIAFRPVSPFSRGSGRMEDILPCAYSLSKLVELVSRSLNYTSQ